MPTKIVSGELFIWRHKLNRILHIIIFILAVQSAGYSQLSIIKSGKQYGVNYNGNELLSPAFDTILPLSDKKEICIACVKSQLPSTNKFIRMNTSVFRCRYYNTDKTQLIIKINNDTCGYFSMGKKTMDEMTSSPNYITVTSNNKKYIVTNQFKQITYKGYDNVWPSELDGYFVTENKTIGASYLNGLIDKNEQEIIPMKYTGISVNPYDSLIATCTAQLRMNGMDDVYDMEGKLLKSYNRHVEFATKNFVVHKIFEPIEYYVVHDIKEDKDTEIPAENIRYLGNDSVEITFKGKNHIANLANLEELKFIEYDKNKSSH